MENSPATPLGKKVCSRTACIARRPTQPVIPLPRGALGLPLAIAAQVLSVADKIARIVSSSSNFK